MRADRSRPLGPAAVSFARYLNGVHARIHPLFVEGFLGSLQSLPASDPANEADLFTRLEIVIGPGGRVAKTGIVRTSGLASFDMAALEAVERAQPFDPPPSDVISGDGNMYVQWTFYRDERCACSAMNARLALLR